ncbi:MAG: hypothetical protein KF793_10080 [Nitrospira sp.]|nr:hypothetical protein [Nitrospira sp.]
MREKQGTPKFLPGTSHRFLSAGLPSPARQGVNVPRFRSSRYFFLLLFLLVCSGCTGPILTSRDVQQTSGWLIRLDSFHSSAVSRVVYDHPVSWQADDLSAILTRLYLEERLGMMDTAKPAKPVFSLEEMTLIQPVIRRAFQEAGAREWIAFLFAEPQGAEARVTSGALFVERQKLHVVVANHHTVVAQTSEELARVRANPLYSIQGSGGVVAFEPPRFGLGAKANWSGGHRASASELILDHRAFLSYLTHATSRETPIRALPPSGEQGQVESQRFSDGRSDQGASNETTVDRLQGEIARLKQQLAEKELEIDRLKAELLRSYPKP